MKARQRRLAGLMVVLVVLGSTVALVLTALEDNIVFFFSPTELVTRSDLPVERTLRMGGLVKAGSVTHEADGSTLSFVVTDLDHEVRVTYRGILPDLFREGQGVVAEGRLMDDGSFLAIGVLAKHDENYMPPEVAEALKKSGQWKHNTGKAP